MLFRWNESWAIDRDATSVRRLANKKGDETEFEPAPKTRVPALVVLPPARRSRLFARVSTLGTMSAINGSQHPSGSFLRYHIRRRRVPLAHYRERYQRLVKIFGCDLSKITWFIQSRAIWSSVVRSLSASDIWSETSEQNSRLHNSLKW